MTPFVTSRGRQHMTWPEDMKCVALSRVSHMVGTRCLVDVYAPDSQSLFRASFISLLRTYILSPTAASPPPALLAHLSSPRVSLLDLSYLDDDSGTTLLHEAARRKDLRLVELVVRAGADVFVRDRRGRPVADAAGKDDRVKVFLRQCAFAQRVVPPS